MRCGRGSFIPRYELLREGRRPGIVTIVMMQHPKGARGQRGTRMDIRFWGTRGSLAKPGRITLRHGGNTSCVEVRGDDATLIVLDCGSGAHGLGPLQAAGHAGLLLSVRQRMHDCPGTGGGH